MKTVLGSWLGLLLCVLLVSTAVTAQTMTSVAGIQGNSSGAGNSIGVPNSVVMDSSSNLYVGSGGATNGSTIYRVSPAGAKTLYAGVFGTDGYNGNNAPTASQFNAIEDLWLDSANNLYIADSGNRIIRRITPGGVLTTVAGVQGDSSGAGNSIGIPLGVAVDSAGNIFVSSTGSTNGATIYRITPAGAKTLYAGVFGVEGYNGNNTLTTTQFNTPTDLWFDNANNLYISDSGNRLIRRITPAGVITNVAGVQGSSNGAGNSIGVPLAAALDPGGNIYVAASGATNGSTVYRVTSAGAKSLFAGVFGTDGYNGDGAATASQMNAPTDIYRRGSVLFVADSGNRLIRRIAQVASAASVTVSGRVTTSEGTSVAKSIVTLTRQDGTVRTVVSSPLGYFTFEDVPAGETYIVTVEHKSHQFDPQVITVVDTIYDLELSAYQSKR